MTQIILPREYDPDFAHPGVKPKSHSVLNQRGRDNNVIEFWHVPEASGLATKGILGTNAVASGTAIVNPEGLVSTAAAVNFFDIGTNTFNNMMSGATSTRISMGFRFQTISGSDIDHNTLVSFYITGSSNSVLIRLNTTGTIQGGGRSQAGDSFQSVTSSRTIVIDRDYQMTCLLDYIGDSIIVLIDGEIWASGSVTFGSNTLATGTATATDGFNGSTDNDRRSDLITRYAIFQKNTIIPEIYPDPYQFLSSASPTPYFFPAAESLTGPIYGPLGGPLTGVL